MVNQNEIVEKLNLAKKNAGMTLQQLAEKSGLTLGTVNKIMSGALKSITADKLQSLADALGVSIDSLVSTAKTGTADEFFGYVKIACISPSLKVGACRSNADEIIRRVKEASKNGVKIALLPELAVTGYTCGDLFFSKILLDEAKRQVSRIASELALCPTVTVVGAPFACGSDKLYNVAFVLYRGKVLGIVPKTHLPNYNEFDEKRYFTPAPSFNSTALFDGYEVPFGTDILFENTFSGDSTFAVEICEDVWVDVPPSCMHARHGAKILLNLSASNETVVKGEYRKQMVSMQSAKTGTVYAYCSAGPDESTSSLVFSAHNIICENGVTLAESKPFESGYAEALADVSLLAHERKRLNHREDMCSDGYVTVKYDMPLASSEMRVYPTLPFVPSDKKQLAERTEMLMKMQCYALKKRIEHTGAKKLVLGLSGGADSAMALLTACNAMKMIGKSSSDVVAVVLPCKLGTSERTKSNAVKLANAVGATVSIVDITKSVLQHFEDIGHDPSVKDVVYENAQARERTKVLMDVANSLGGLVLGTGDMSESALGFCTYGGDQLAMYDVNAGYPKTLIKAMLAYYASQSKPPLCDVLRDIVNTPISPELLPDGANNQQTESILGPYELHDFFLFHLIRNGFTPSKTFYLAKTAFGTKYDDKTLINTEKTFITRFFASQFKRSASADGIKTGSVDLRAGWLMPSDAVCETWLDDLSRITEGK